MKILVLDPGESTGWVAYDTETKELVGGTVVRDFSEMHLLLCTVKYDAIVYEAFQLYPGSAKSLTWNEFYPCQVIGIIRMSAEEEGSERKLSLVKQTPSVKKFSGGLDWKWKQFIQDNPDKTEHTKDAFLHLKYYLIQQGLCW